MIGMIGIMGFVGAIIAGVTAAISIAVGATQAAQNAKLAKKQEEVQDKQNHIAAKRRRAESNVEAKRRRSALNQASIGNAVARWKIRKMGAETREMNRRTAMMGAHIKPSSWQRRSYYGNA